MLKPIHTYSVSKKYLPVVFYSFGAFFTYILLKETHGITFWEDYSWLNIPKADKLAHIFIFTVLMWIRQLYNPKKIKENASLLLAYGILIEILQGSLTQTRSFDVMDIMADAIGVGFGYALSQLKFLNKILKLQD